MEARLKEDVFIRFIRLDLRSKTGRGAVYENTRAESVIGGPGALRV